jgi:Icc-related predicted phosphoesterase
VRIHLISDLHGAVDSLPLAAKGCDLLIVLGDLINVLDYRAMEGILVDIFGREPVAEAAHLRARGRYSEAREAMRRRRVPDAEARERFVSLAREQYRAVFAALPDGAVVTYGNVDIPELLRASAPDRIRVVDGEVLDLDGERFGIVGGGIRTPLGIPGEVEEEDYDRKLARLGTVDVICTHQPPRIPWLVYDVVGKRFEPGSTGLVGYINERRPRFGYFGHVHQPLVDRMTMGETRLINVGHFRATGRPWVHDTAA